MNWQDFQAAFEDAKRTLGKADSVACDMAWMLVGRLRAARVDPSALSRLKRELRDFNIHTGRWK